MGNYVSRGENYVKKYIPTPGNVVINPERPERKPNAGIININEQEPGVLRGQIMNLWPGADEMDLDVKKGDMVYFRTGQAEKIPYMETVLVVVPYDKLIMQD